MTQTYFSYKKPGVHHLWMRLRRRSTTKRGAPHVRRKLDGNHELATRASTDRPSRVCEVLQSSARGPWKRGAPKNNRRLTQSLIAHTSARIACKLARWVSMRTEQDDFYLHPTHVANFSLVCPYYVCIRDFISEIYWNMKCGAINA